MASPPDAAEGTVPDRSMFGEKTLLRIIACGSVDDGKSTLIGRLLLDSDVLPVDQHATLQAASERFGSTAAGHIDPALLLDALADERAQGITISVGYRYFSTAERSFIVADAPGHEQYVGNMAMAASTADIAILLLDAGKGILPQTRRHSHILSLMGLRHIVLAVNKMDQVNWDPTTFKRLVDDYKVFAAQLGFAEIHAVPVAALTGDNVVRRGESMPWYSGPTLLRCLELIEGSADIAPGAFRMPVQRISRGNENFRGYAGTIVGGRIRPGDRIAVLPSEEIALVGRIETFDGSLDEAIAGQAVTISLDRPMDIGRGDVLSDVIDRPMIADRFSAHILWLGRAPMLPGRSYLLQMGHAYAEAQISGLDGVVDLETMTMVSAETLARNESGLCRIVLDHPVVCDSYRRNRKAGGFIMVDRVSNMTVACGMIRDELHPAADIRWQPLKIGKAERAVLLGQKSCVLWFTGLSGAGKSTIADMVEQKLFALGRHTMLLDGDNIRHGLNRDLGFSDADRVENIRRISEVAKLMTQAGLIVLVSFISPFRNERQMARDMIGQNEFFEIFVDAPLEVCMARDPKGLYKKAASGGIADFTGISSPYDRPEAPDLHLRTDQTTVEASVARILTLLEAREIL